MSAPIVDLAQAVTDLLNTVGAFTPALNATREWMPFYELPSAATQKVSVYPMTDDSPSKIDRSRWQHDLVIDIAIQKKLTGDTNAEKDAVIATADLICEYVKANRPSRPEKLMGATVHVLLDRLLFKDHKLFTGVVRLTFVAAR